MAVSKKKRSLGRLLAILLILALIAGVAVYLGTYYHASPDAMETIANPPAGVTVETADGRIAFVPEHPTAGLIFYPGGKVQYEAYAPLMAACAERGILCVLVHMPCNLAVFAPNAADGIAEQYPEINRWYIGGHSLGGAFAARYAAKHADALEGLILLAAYATDDLKDSGLAVLSVVGTEDGVLNVGKYDACRTNLPADAKECVIEGGNHAQFGSYGAQSGDGTAKITPGEQWAQTVSAIAARMGANDKED